MKLALLSFFLFINFTQPKSELGTIELVVSETSSDEGVIQLLIFDQEDGWPDSLDEAWKMVTIPIKNGIAKKTIPNVSPGNYAITVFHDHDKNGQIRKNKVGYPLDDFGFSNNPSIVFGIPSFHKCSKKVAAGKATLFEIELR
ncbi:DUF2141 domain-containing protein [uncultured Algoriphagus sp.]|uniref:DUF2141 domain-containing protein n=1 Tax=uncultured Algoriphagus sp. TaxID=417365 RepID=UPI0030EEB7CD|tara:strand:- start:4261 stop:4689 length:429 start_codon:yes stop_codon:yes gene_type:complete